MAVDAPGLEGSCREVEAWRHEEGPGKAQLQQKISELWRCQDHGLTKDSCGSGVGPARAVCAAEGRARELTQVLWKSPEDCEWVPDI